MNKFHKALVSLVLTALLASALAACGGGYGGGGNAMYHTPPTPVPTKTH